MRLLPAAGRRSANHDPHPRIRTQGRRGKMRGPPRRFYCKQLRERQKSFVLLRNPDPSPTVFAEPRNLDKDPNLGHYQDVGHRELTSWHLPGSMLKCPRDNAFRGAALLKRYIG